MPTDLIECLQLWRAAEKEQALFYRALAAEAEERGNAALSERFNDLHADEQHHVSRLTARLLELGAAPGELAGIAPPPASFDVWEAAARDREQHEVGRYSAALEKGEPAMDETTAALVAEILDTERHHAQELGGKWTPA
ncbi:MAG TPA: ferritin-like domain-containing protein [Longimicrobiaceae bacterium]|jgi:rubrerythrin|nr:ferritin-like domain-containing protein [Longimicrobiaceae bacterium]